MPKKIRSTDNNDTATAKVEDIYKKKSHHEHILSVPDTYIGTITPDELSMFIYDEDANKIAEDTIEYIAGLFKIYDEILINARDNTVREDNCRTIKVNVNKDTGEITVWNDGNGIPICKHSEYDIYVPELIFGHLLTSSNYDKKGKQVGGKNGLGSKCVWNGGFIPTYNGVIKIAKNITTTDKLIGDDGTVRNIKNIITGTGPLYEIEQANGESYKVNDQHILTLHMPDHKVIYWNADNYWEVRWWDHANQCICVKKFRSARSEIKCPECNATFSGNMGRHYRRVHKGIHVPKKERKPPTTNAPDTEEVKIARQSAEEFCKTISDDNVFDISVQDYINLPIGTQKRLAGLRGKCVDWLKQEVELDPYVLGLWLGDGYSTGCGYTCDAENDPQLIRYLEEWGSKNDAQIRQHQNRFQFGISSKSNFGKPGSNPLKNMLAKYNLINNKHIPKEYIVNDRDTRLKVLAGLIDTDGTVQRNGTRIVITQCIEHKQLMDDLVFLARSLGFYCSLTTKKTSWKVNGELKKGICYNVNISGNLEDIPTQLPRKKCANLIRKSELTTGFIKIKDAGIGDYVGFELDGNQRFVVNDFTVTHNCANVYSSRFGVHIVSRDTTGKPKEYKQVFENNMYKINPPVVIDLKDSKSLTPFTCISFIPDYAKFGTNGLTDGMYRLFLKRAFDIAACTPPEVKVWLNDTEIKCKDFRDYIDMYYDKKPTMVYKKFNSRWEIGIVFDREYGDKHLSFVNGILTYQGGTHVEHVISTVVRKVIAYIKSSAKHKALKIQSSTIRQYLTFFINCVVEDPGFNSQVKEYMNSKMADWCNCGNNCPDTRCDIDDAFIKELCDTGLMKEVVEMSMFKETRELSRTDGKKTSNLKCIDKLIDADWAGKRNSEKTSLILTEGDSAKAFAVAGLSVIGKEAFGVFPLRGKLLNVRKATAKQIKDNAEFINLKTILGLKQGMTYDDVSKLRYGSIIILTDQDPDGSHIKGLIINMFEHFWPSLLQLDGFIKTINTPIVKAWKRTDKAKKDINTFYTISDFHKWTETIDISKWEYKYYKGLGTSTEKEAKESFVDFSNKIITFTWETDDNSNDNIQQDDEQSETIDDSYLNSKSHLAIAKAFDKNRANERKSWLKKFDKDKLIEYRGQMNIPYSDFIDKDLIFFSNLDNMRSIPSIVDGLKPSQRKILFACIRRGRKSKEVKVAQLAGYVSEHTEYHHGEESLNSTIIGLAQNFPGSNNINLLKPNGNFGYRRLGGKEHSSPRYIFTELTPITNKIYREEDDYILEYNYEEGRQIEPIHYLAILPMQLVNGANGIGTGFSTRLLPFNPLDIVDNLKRLISEKEPVDMIPWFNGFTGTVEHADGKKTGMQYKISGKYTVDGKNVNITEIPIIDGWIEQYEKKLESKVSMSKDDQKKIEQLTTSPSNNKVNIQVVFKGSELQGLFKRSGELDKFLGMHQNVSITNMHLYNSEGKLTKYDSINDILQDFYKYRLKMYEKRRNFFLLKLQNELNIYAFKVKFIKEYLNGTLLISRKKVADVIDQLETKKYPRLAHSHTVAESDKTYRYLTDMSILTLTDDKIAELEAKMRECELEYETYLHTPIKNIWLRELDEFLEAYKIFLEEWENEMNLSDKSHDKKLRSKKVKTK